MRPSPASPKPQRRTPRRRRRTVVVGATVLVLLVACSSPSRSRATGRRQKATTSTVTHRTAHPTGTQRTGQGASPTSGSAAAGTGGAGTGSASKPPVPPGPNGRTSTGGAHAGTSESGSSGGGGAGSSGGPATGASPSNSVVGVARQSVQDVVLLHDVAAGLGRPNGLPEGTAADQAAHLVSQISAQHTLVANANDAAHLAASDPAARLEQALGSYVSLASILEKSARSSSKTLPASFAQRLGAADVVWKAAVTSLQEHASLDLLKNLPPLLMPGSSTSTVPPPPR